MRTFRYRRFITIEAYDELLAEMTEFPQVEVKMLERFGSDWTVEVDVSTHDENLAVCLKLRRDHPFTEISPAK